MEIGEQERKDLFSFYFPRPYPFKERTRAGNKKRTKTRGKELFSFLSPTSFLFERGEEIGKKKKARKILSFLIAEESISSPLFGILDLVNSTSSFGRIDTLSRVIPQA